MFTELNDRRIPTVNLSVLYICVRQVVALSLHYERLANRNERNNFKKRQIQERNIIAPKLIPASVFNSFIPLYKFDLLQ